MCAAGQTHLNSLRSLAFARDDVIPNEERNRSEPRVDGNLDAFALMFAVRDVYKLTRLDL